ncbi:MAG: metal-sensitive transcriptional regulator [Patescibacteria group bacterium]|jgi:DNA-binding FrmR family transcriptional regulator
MKKITRTKTSEQRINNIIGQLEGVKKMLANERRDCFSPLIQLKAARSALSSLMEKIVSDELGHCLTGRDKIDKGKMEKIFKEIINNK